MYCGIGEDAVQPRKPSQDAGVNLRLPDRASRLPQDFRLHHVKKSLIWRSEELRGMYGGTMIDLRGGIPGLTTS